MIALTHTQSGAFYLYSTGLGQPTRVSPGKWGDQAPSLCQEAWSTTITDFDSREMPQ